ncbi:hypothetical protein ABW20_dc0108289 [Dactylellina cionopaga]|nr:hypothetical protein ABW20_dc0108289 [Dactylellina cionopaga]
MLSAAQAMLFYAARDKSQSYPASLHRDPILAAKLRHKLHQISPRPPQSLLHRQARHFTDFEEAVEEAARSFSAIESETAWSCPVKNIRYSDLPSQMDFDQGAAPDEEFFDTHQAVPEYTYMRKKSNKRSFKSDKLNVLLNRQKIGWTNERHLLQMSPRMRVVDAVNEGDEIALGWSSRELEVSDEAISRKADSDACKGIHESGIQTENRSESRGGQESDGRERIRDEAGEVPSGDFAQRISATLEDILMTIQEFEGVADQEVIEQLDSVVDALTREIDRHLNGSADDKEEYDIDIDWGNIGMGNKIKPDSEEGERWEFEEENACSGWMK